MLLTGNERVDDEVDDLVNSLEDEIQADGDIND